MKRFLTLTVILSVFRASAQNFSEIVYDNHVYDEAVRSIDISVSQLSCIPLVIPLSGNRYFDIRFDDLNSKLRDLKFTVIHCTYDWKPSAGLQKFEYISGFEEVYIDDYSYSMNTIQSYISYHFRFPDENMKPIKSGNYLLCVYEDENTLLFTHRLMFVENKVDINPEFRFSTNVGERNTHQEFNFSIDPGQTRLNNPFQSVKVVVMQNRRADNAILFEHPVFMNGNILSYERMGANTIEGGSEFRRFNMQSMIKLLEHIVKIDRLEESYHVYIYPDEDRSYMPYVSETDLDGCCILLTEEVGYEADYANVHFELRYPEPLEGDLYIFGEMTQWRFSDEAKMKFNPSRGVYEGSLYLKAGYYNYTYLYVPPGEERGNYSIEGSHWETENSYIFLVYYSPEGSNYDRLIGYRQSYFTEK